MSSLVFKGSCKFMSTKRFAVPAQDAAQGPQSVELDRKRMDVDQGDDNGVKQTTV